MQNVIELPIEFEGNSGVLKDASDLEQLLRILSQRYSVETVQECSKGIIKQLKLEEEIELERAALNFMSRAE